MTISSWGSVTVIRCTRLPKPSTKLAARSSTDLDDDLVSLLHRPVFVSFVLLGIGLATAKRYAADGYGVVNLSRSAIPLDGAVHMPRVQQASFGASERFAVSPGREDEGYFHMPGGQSGHPLSPFYRAGHEDWAEGEPTPFLPGTTRHRLTLSP